jgi:copper homeostasis protein
MPFLLEVIAFDLVSCAVAANAGAHRIELCANPPEGGTTPSLGMMKLARQITPLPLFPIIRPRGGDFLYTEDEFACMQRDIQMAKQIGCDGVVLGMLKSDGNIDRERTARLVDLAYPMEVTFHRAFDRARDPQEALETIIQIGCTRVLTSGQHPTALEGSEIIRQLIEAADERIIIMPGSGVRSSNLESLHEQTGATEFHSSARTQVASAMKYNSPTMKEQLTSVQLDVDEVKRLASTLQKIKATNP